MVTKTGPSSAKLGSFAWDAPLLLDDRVTEDERMPKRRGAERPVRLLEPGALSMSPPCHEPGGGQHQGTHDVHALILGRAVTGLPAFAP